MMLTGVCSGSARYEMRMSPSPGRFGFRPRNNVFPSRIQPRGVAGGATVVVASRPASVSGDSVKSPRRVSVATRLCDVTSLAGLTWPCGTRKPFELIVSGDQACTYLKEAPFCVSVHW